MVARTVVETLRAVHESPADVDMVMSIIEKTAKDSEPAVRGEMLEHLPHIMMVCHEVGIPSLQSIVDQLVPILLSTITDTDNQVRKTAQTALLVLTEQNLFSQQYEKEHLCPYIVNLTHFDQCADYHTSIVELMSKMAPLLGSDLTEQMFVPRFTALCVNDNVTIRRTCANNFGDFCAVVSRHVTETQLLPRFCELARDCDWGVRASCAGVIMSVSCACCLQTRKSVLAPLFATLLADVTRWVRMSAFHSLGAFITTFAEPSITGLAYDQQGELILTNPEGFEFRFLGQKPKYCGRLDSLLQEIVAKQEEAESQEQYLTITHTDQSVDNQYNSFLYWREPLPDIDVDLNPCSQGEEISQLPINPSSSCVKEDLTSSSQSFANDESITSNNFANSGGSTAPSQTTVYNEFSTSSQISLLCSHLAAAGRQLGEMPRLPDEESPSPEPQQDIVPQPLIDHFVSMCDPANAVIDIDLAHHCAFSLPAVALTLGPAHWDLLRDTYTTLASDRQWKVRRTVASSIHELAVIVGEDMATQDLVPIFSGLIKDLDEVRIGALRHLAYFLRLVRPSGRNQFLPRLADFLKTEYDYNWRFREVLAGQLLQSLVLFSPADTCAHLTPVAISLLLDHVAAVRQMALSLVTQLVNHVSMDISLLRGLLAELAEQFAHSARWSRRQTFAQLCSHLVNDGLLSDEMFARDVLPHLLDLSWDPVPNVRLTVARTLSVDVMDNDFFCNEQNPHHEVLVQTLKRLQGDKDRDVRYYASLKPKRSQMSHLYKEQEDMCNQNNSSLEDEVQKVRLQRRVNSRNATSQ